MPKVDAQVAQTQGLGPLSDGFTAEVQQIAALALFAKALPRWCMNRGIATNISIQCRGPEISIDIGLSANAKSADADDLLRCLRDWERLDRLELLVDEFRNAGLPSEVIDPMIEEAEALARKLAPPEGEED